MKLPRFRLRTLMSAVLAAAGLLCTVSSVRVDVSDLPGGMATATAISLDPLSIAMGIFLMILGLILVRRTCG